MKGKQAIFEFIEEHEAEIPVRRMMKYIYTVSRSGYYKWKKEKAQRTTREVKDKPLLEEMKVIYKKHGGNLGNLRFKMEIEKVCKVNVNWKRISRMRQAYNLPLLTKRRPRRVYAKVHHKIENLLDRNFTAVKPGVKYSIDITYLEITKPYRYFIYLCAIKDLFNNEIVAYSIGDTQELSLVFEALAELEKKGPVKGAILHSDQGTQFTSPQYMNKLTAMNLTQSMSRRGNCWDNACIESFFGKLKTEMPGFTIPETKKEMIQAVTNYIQYYNQIRPQLKLKMSPIEYREAYIVHRTSEESKRLSGQFIWRGWHDRLV